MNMVRICRKYLIGNGKQQMNKQLLISTVNEEYQEKKEIFEQ